jgi:hypothetical protein
MKQEPTEPPKIEFTTRQLTAIREEFLSLIDDGDPLEREQKTPESPLTNSPWGFYETDDCSEDHANWVRLRYCDELQRRLMKRSE